MGTTTPPPFDPDGLIKILAVRLAAREIELLAIRRVLERDRPGFQAQFEREFETLWNKHQAPNILHAYRTLRDPEKSLSAEDMRFAKEPDEQ
jgi:hypothetical protein